MKKFFLIISLMILFSYADSYSNGFKFFIKAKHMLRSGNTSKANELFIKAKNNFEKDNKNALALEKLSELYCNGWGVDKNENQAKQYLNKAMSIIPNINIFDKCVKQLKENK